MAYFFVRASKDSTVRPRARMRLRNVPGAISRWSGTEIHRPTWCYAARWETGPPQGRERKRRPVRAALEIC